MKSSCFHAGCMGKHIQIRDVPEALHSAIKAQAASDGLSMSAYIRRLLERDLKRPNWAAIDARMAKMKKVKLGDSTVEILREERNRP